MPRHKKPKTLKALCIESISADIGHHKGQIPFISRLPTCLLDVIHEHVLDHSNAQEHTCVERLGCKLSIMNFSQLRWVGRSPPPNLQPPDRQLFERCQNLTDIDLSMNNLRRKEWGRLFSVIKRIHKLQVYNTEITDECLVLLADHSPNLQYLDLSDCENITNVGMLNLIHCKNGVWTCSKLSSLDVVGSQVDTEGATYVLEHSKALLYFYFLQLCKVIHCMAQTAQLNQAEPPQLCLTSLVFHHNHYFTYDQATSCIKACPYLTELEICSGRFGKANYDYIRHLRRLHELSFFAKFNDDISFSHVLLPTLSDLGPTLTSLQLTEIQGLSLTLLGRNCPCLLKLQIGLRSVSLSNDETPHEGEMLFSNLLELSVFRKDAGIFDVESLGLLLFSCHKLESLLLSNLECLNDSFVMDWLARNPLCALEYFEVVAWHRLSSTGLWRLLHHCGNLKHLVVPTTHYLSNHAILLLNREVAERVWDIEIKTVSKGYGLDIERYRVGGIL